MSHLKLYKLTHVALTFGLPSCDMAQKVGQAFSPQLTQDNIVFMLAATFPD